MGYTTMTRTESDYASHLELRAELARRDEYIAYLKEQLADQGADLETIRRYAADLINKLKGTL